MIVADANLLINYVCGTPFSEMARLVKAKDADWISPHLWQAEVLNGLLVMHRAGLLDLEPALRAYRNAASTTATDIRDIESDVILTTARRFSLTAYDATYVALAHTLGVPLITEDKQILRACPDIARSMREFLSPPRPPLAVREPGSAYRKQQPRTRATGRMQPKNTRKNRR
jgi:predicted nucleic acid-binding protein